MNKRVLVTRPAGQAERLCSLIEAAGGEAVRLPALEIHELEDTSQLESYQAIPIINRLLISGTL